MKTRITHAGLSVIPWLSLCAVLFVCGTASAQNQRYYPQAPVYPQQQQPPPQQYYQPAPNYQQPPANYGAQGYAYPQQPQKQYESPIEFLPKFGKRMSEVVRRLFYGQDPTGWDNPPPGYAPNGGYSLESPPRQQQNPGYQQPPQGYAPQQPGYQYPPQQGQAQPRYSYPPQQPAQPSRTQQTPPAAGKSTAPAPTTQNKSTNRTYTPPKVTQSPPKTSSSKTPAPLPTPPQTKAPIPEPPANTTARRSETSPPPREQTASTPSGNGFLKGRKTAKPGRVVSPYPPYKELDVTGLDSGSLALDPTTQKVFEVP